jgi:hypothetical protein
MGAYVRAACRCMAAILLVLGAGHGDANGGAAGGEADANRGRARGVRRAMATSRLAIQSPGERVRGRTAMSALVSVCAAKASRCLEYNITDRWSPYAEIPYIVNRFQGPNPHCPATAPPQCAHIPALKTPHPECSSMTASTMATGRTDPGAAYNGDIEAISIRRM